MVDYQGKVAVITGAASGVGRGLALYCASIGMKLALGDINGGKLRELAKELKAQNADVLTYVFNVAKDQEFKAFAEKTITEFNAVDIFFNNAGVSVPGEIWSLPAEEWKWVMDVNVLGPVNGIRAFVPFMIAQDKDCCVVNTASIAGLLPAFNAPVYSASKHAVVGLTEVLNFQLQDVGAKVRAFLLCPGYIATNLHNCMENRPSDYTGADDYFQSSDFKERYDIMAANVINGISVEKLVAVIFDALEKDQYYIHTHEEFLPLIGKRASNIVKGRRPRSPGQYKVQK